LFLKLTRKWGKWGGNFQKEKQIGGEFSQKFNCPFQMPNAHGNCGGWGKMPSRILRNKYILGWPNLRENKRRKLIWG
jgi:hypothetical protein